MCLSFEEEESHFFFAVDQSFPNLEVTYRCCTRCRTSKKKYPTGEMREQNT